MHHTTRAAYVGRFAPSPTGPMHLGSAVAALASWLDAHAARHAGLSSCWLVRIEDLDTQRCSEAAATTILRQLQSLGLTPDASPQWQSRRLPHYRHALQTLQAHGLAYPCQCTRRDIEAAWQARGVQRQRFQTLIYPGTCRSAQHVNPVRVWRFLTEGEQTSHTVRWHDRRLGWQQQDVSKEVGDFALLRGDGIWSYQIGCVVDDAEQGITHIVRGEDLADNTARQILLQQALGYTRPVYLHLPLARDAWGEKLSKGNQAPSIDGCPPLEVLCQAAHILGLPPVTASTVPDALLSWTRAWSDLYPLSASDDDAPA